MAGVPIVAGMNVRSGPTMPVMHRTVVVFVRRGSGWIVMRVVHGERR